MNEPPLNGCDRHKEENLGIERSTHRQCSGGIRTCVEGPMNSLMKFLINTYVIFNNKAKQKCAADMPVLGVGVNTWIHPTVLLASSR